MGPQFGGDWRQRIAGLLIAGVCLFGAAPAARADIWDWLVQAVSAESEDPIPANYDVSGIPQGAIVTGENEQRVLQFGKDVIELYPNTVVTVEVSEGKVRTVQLLGGTVKVHVSKRKKSEPFAVESSHLVAVVKGTVFEVSTSASGSAVSVYEGLVAVKSRGRVGGTNVSPGKTATVQSRDAAPSVRDTPEGGAASATGAAPAAKGPPIGHPTTGPQPGAKSAGAPGAKPVKAAKTLLDQPQKTPPAGGEAAKKDKKKDKDKEKDKKDKHNHGHH